mmetsp:Transcript_2699/g.3715  ORF Transcript_2699/g.3715 Transcript_2699/m.3715 type:complete len:196 (+) Transcript_2699:94-681(+)|eukprot:CAMPEP_0185256012 /NCGR_PEP_ID=MMETSP1359-20130426/5077_1 /TAXON_ID=552665 /ORGANISM="Bigelowiella longifila, Strain CCMP242" /LENGTH=195 /DNA_ID=CAMNT_0027840305 /DNA_START=92 /DNA_END=679 /DNA_ORIENTATION=+
MASNEKSQQDTEDKEHPLNSKWILYFHSMEDTKNWDLESYAKVYEISTVETFWRVFNNIKSDITKGHWFLMRENIKPMWEDPENEHGGAWVFDVKTDNAETAMLEASMATVGERILAEPKESCSEVTGLSMTMQKSGSRIKIWNRDKNKNDMKKLNMEIPHLTKSGAIEGCYYKMHKGGRKNYKGRAGGRSGGRR